MQQLSHRPAWAHRAVTAVVAALALTACGRGGAEPPAGSGSALPAVSVRTAVVERMTLPVTVAATGTITSRPGSVATLSAPSLTRITRVYVATGDRVQAGQPLVAFDQAPFTAVFRQASAARQTAQQAYDRASRLAGQGIVPRRDVETARAALAQADAALVVARQALARATLRSPIAGVVARNAAVLDASADPAQPLVQIVDPSALEVRVLLTPGDAAHVRAGAPVTLTGGTGAGGEALGTGTVVAVAATVDSLSGGVEARARVTRAARALRLGEVVRVAVEAGSRVDALVVPAASLVPATAGDGYQLFAVGRGDTVHVRPVTVGVRTEQVAEVVRGATAGEIVVADGAYGVEDGVRVTPQGAPEHPARTAAPPDVARDVPRTAIVPASPHAPAAGARP